MEILNNHPGGSMQNRLEMAQVEREGQVQEAVVVASAETAGPEPRPW